MVSDETIAKRASWPPVSCFSQEGRLSGCTLRVGSYVFPESRRGFAARNYYSHSRLSAIARQSSCFFLDMYVSVHCDSILQNSFRVCIAFYEAPGIILSQRGIVMLPMYRFLEAWAISSKVERVFYFVLCRWTGFSIRHQGPSSSIFSIFSDLWSIYSFPTTSNTDRDMEGRVGIRRLHFVESNCYITVLWLKQLRWTEIRVDIGFSITVLRTSEIDPHIAPRTVIFRSSCRFWVCWLFLELFSIFLYTRKICSQKRTS